MLRALIVFLISLVSFCIAQNLDVQKIDSVVAKAYATFKPTGLSVAVVDSDKVIYKKALGYANIKTGQTLETEDLFNIASCSKAFTAASIGLMVEHGKLSWNDKVTDYLPDFKLADPYITDNLNIEDILCHRSGLATFYGDLLWYGTDYSNKEIMRRMQYLPVKNEFRNSYGYQNNMFMLAGEILQKVSGLSWEQFVQKNFFTPLAMEHSRTSSDSLKPGDKIAMPHIKNSLIELYNFNGSKPAGAIYSSVEDLAHWIEMLLQHGNYKETEIIKSNTLEMLFTIHNPFRFSSFSHKKFGRTFFGYGLGWYISDFYGTRIVEHNGGMPGYISKVTLLPEKNIGFVVLNNNQDGLVNEVVKYGLLDLINNHAPVDRSEQFEKIKTKLDSTENVARQKRLDGRIENTKPSLSPDQYCGLYRDKMYGDTEIKLDGKNLFFSMLPSAKYFSGKMEHWHYDTFKVQFNDPFLTYALIVFTLNSSGSVNGFTIDLPNNDFHFENLDFKRVENHKSDQN